MADMFDYLSWRGDIRFAQLPINPVDALIFSTLSYIRFQNMVPETAKQWISLKEVAEAVFATQNPEALCRVPQDAELLHAAAKTARFGNVGMTLYRDILIPEEDTQFAAMTFMMDDGTVYMAFRGTDNTLVGWKEDFNMSFQEQIPAQRLAQEYLRDFAAVSRVPIWMGGHSKGGNLAVYAAAKCDHLIQSRIIEVYNQDGPGFSASMMEDPGYRRILPKLRTFVPQSSVIGMLLEHEEPYTIVKSNGMGLMQHDPYTWEIMGANFVLLEDLTEDSLFLDKTFKNWLAGMSNADRSAFFDTVFDLINSGNADHVRDLLQPDNLRTYLKTLKSDENMRHIIGSELKSLLESAKQVHLNKKS